MGLPLERVQASLRFSLGRGTTADETRIAAAAVADAVERQRRR
jgi:cysteine sulfinate desulfinase/cysteine desulfurase-like protein